MRKIFLATLVAIFGAGCAASTKNVGSLVLPTSGRQVDIVQHRSDSHGCAELVVLQTYDAAGQLIDSQQGRARSLPCTLVEVGIEAGSRVGSAAIIARGMVNAAKATRPDNVDINNSNSQSQGQKQKQDQGQYSENVNINSNNNVWHGGSVKGGGSEGHGNNGNGNGNGDGTNPGTGHHHDNGDNN
jgi:hypothetical protein